MKIVSILLFILLGQVKDATTHEPLIGATVLIEQTGQGTTTDFEGSFSLQVSRDATLEVSYIGYRSQRVAATSSDTLFIYMHEETELLSEVEITGQRATNNELALVRAEREALVVSSGISAQQISRASDKDAGEAIRRVQGVSLIDDKFVMVRGLSQRYNQVWLNGAAVPSSEADSRAFSFDLIPSSQLDNLRVIKSPAAEYPADFSGGMILIETKQVPEQRTWSFDLSVSANDRTHFRPFYRQHRAENDWTTSRLRPIVDASAGILGTETWSLPRGQHLSMLLSANYSHQYKAYTDMTNNLLGTYDEAQQRPAYLRTSTDNQYNIHDRVGAMFNLNYSRRSGKDRIELKNIFNMLMRNRYTSRDGVSAQSDHEQQAEYNYQSRLTYSAQFTGRHRWTQDVFDWDLGYAYSNRLQPNRRRYLRNDALEPGVMALSSSNDVSRESTTLHEHLGSVALNYTHDFEWGRFCPTLKVGAYGEYRSRSYRTQLWLLTWNQDNRLPENFRYLDLPTELLTDEHFAPDKLYYLEQIRWRNNYDGRQILLSGYAAVNLPWGIFNAYLGVRFEHSDMALTRNTRDREPSPMTSHYTTNDFFPSVNLAWRFREQHQLRASYGMSINRPEFREVSPSVYYDFDLASNVQGNVSLESCRVHNADLRYEFYPTGNAGESVSLAVFYKHFRNPIEWTYTVTGGTDLTYGYQNAEGAYSYGLEGEVKLDLGRIGAKGLSWSFNGSLIRSQVLFPDGSLQPNRPMQGQSPYLINTGFFYRHAATGWSASVLYNRIGKRLIGIGRSVGLTGSEDTANVPDSYEMPRDLLDLSLGKDFGEHWTLRLLCKDVIGERVRYQQGTETIKSYRPGRSFQINIKYKL